jgi:hypothetical protein
VSWQTLGAVAPTELVEARLQLHHAEQVVASAGLSFLAPEPDDSQPNSGWDEGVGALMGRPLPGAGVRVGLRLRDLSLLLVNGQGGVDDELALDGKTLEDGYAWLASALTGAGVQEAAKGIVRTTYEIPPHATASGAPFARSEPGAFAELDRWFANGHDALTALVARMSGASDVRCWPHHFDLGSLAVVDTNPDGSLGSSIGLGLSPGDESYAEPYWYISPWPYPDAATLPALGSGGHWHGEGFTSAILLASDWLEGPPDDQRKRLDAFLDEAVEISRRALAP